MSMVKKTFTYENYLGAKVTRDFYFHLNKTECQAKEALTPGGYLALLDRIVKAKDGPALYNTFREFVLESYGVMSEDGERFIKNAEVRAAFVESPAYDLLMQQLISDDVAAADFVKAVLPAVPKNAIKVVDAPTAGSASAPVLAQA